MTNNKFWSPIGIYCVNCTIFGQLILRKIIHIVATRCHILRLKCTKFDFGWCSVPDPAEGAYNAPPNTLARFTGTSNVREGGRRQREGEKTNIRCFQLHSGASILWGNEARCFVEIEGGIKILHYLNYTKFGQLFVKKSLKLFRVADFSD